MRAVLQSVLVLGSVTVMLIVSGTGEAYVPLSMCRFMSKIFSTLLKRCF